MRRRQLPPPPRRREVGADHPGDRERRETAIRREIVRRDRGERGGERHQRGNREPGDQPRQRRWLDARRQARRRGRDETREGGRRECCRARCGCGRETPGERGEGEAERQARGKRENSARRSRVAARRGESEVGHGRRDCRKRVKVLPPQPHGPTTGDGRGATTFGRFQARLRQERFVDSVTKSRHKFRSNPMNGC